ncbi:MAG: methylated-DNA--[protein]-cysteine S-methyltransferase [Candidatus Bathyarchaeia archaeon]
MWLGLNILCVKKIDDLWFGVILDEKKRVLSCGFSTGEERVRKKVLSAINRPLEIYESEDDDYAFTVLRSMSLIFQGKDPDVHPTIAFEHLPAFTRASLIMTSKIPRGYVSTYVTVAAAVGKPRAARAVGNVESRNPFAPLVPCHRVVNSTLHLGGYGEGLSVKKAFLLREGVLFDGEKVSKRCLWNF